VIFGSGRQGWGFTIPSFATLYANKFGLDRNRMARLLFGDSFFDTQTRRWTRNKHKNNDTNNSNSIASESASDVHQRGFTLFVLAPLFSLYVAIMNDQSTLWSKHSYYHR
jgi:elongation factor 2